MKDDLDRLSDLRDTEIDLSQIDREAWKIRNVTQMQRARHNIRGVIEWALIIALVLFCIWILVPR